MTTINERPKSSIEKEVDKESEKAKNLDEKVKKYLYEKRLNNRISREKPVYSNKRKSVLDPYRTEISVLQKNGATLSEILIFLHTQARPRLDRKIARSTLLRFIQRTENIRGF